MPYTVEDYMKETRKEFLGTLTDADIEEILKTLRPEDRLKGLTPEEIKRYLKKISH